MRTTDQAFVYYNRAQFTSSNMLATMQLEVGHNTQNSQHVRSPIIRPRRRATFKGSHYRARKSHDSKQLTYSVLRARRPSTRMTNTTNTEHQMVTVMQHLQHVSGELGGVPVSDWSQLIISNQCPTKDRATIWPSPPCSLPSRQDRSLECRGTLAENYDVQ